MTKPSDDKLDDETRVLVSVAKRQWERTFDAISEPLMIVDASYVIRRANLALADELGMAIQRVVGQRCYEVRGASAQRFVGSGAGPCAGCPGGRGAALWRRRRRRGPVDARAHVHPASVPRARRGRRREADGVPTTTTSPTSAS